MREGNGMRAPLQSGLTLRISGGTKRRPLHAVVRPSSNTNVSDMSLSIYGFFPPTPGTAAT